MMVPFLLFPRLAPTISTPPHLNLCIHPSYPPSEKNKYVEVCETTGVEEEDPFPSSLSLGRDGSSERCLPSPSRCPTARSRVHRDPDDEPDADDQRPPGPHMPHHATSRPTMSHPLFSSLPTPTATTTLALTVTSRVATIAPAPLCPCGAGTSRRCTARTPQNAGRTYFKCPRRQGTPCRFFRWADDHGPSSMATKTTAARTTRHVSDPSSPSPPPTCAVQPVLGTSPSLVVSEDRAMTATRGVDPPPSTPTPTPAAAAGALREGGADNECARCGEPGHWAKECSVPPPTKRRRDVCFACGGNDGHWARDCPHRGGR